MATIQRITAEVARLVTLYRQPMNVGQVQLTVESWAELIGPMSDDELAAAVNRHLSSSRYFPTPADIIKAHEDFKPTYAHVELPAETNSPQEVYMHRLRRAMFGKPRAEEFYQEKDYARKVQIASEVLGNRMPKDEGGEAFWGFGHLVREVSVKQ